MVMETNGDLRSAFEPKCFQDKHKFNDDDFFTLTSTEQKRVEELCSAAFDEYQSLHSDSPTDTFDIQTPELMREKHIQYLLKSLISVPAHYETLDASRPWMVYWAVHALALLNVKVPDGIANKVILFLKSCEHADGGYGGGPGQLPHLCTTYAAVMALCTIGTDQAYDSINIKSLSSFLLSMKDADGGFLMHQGGEKDIRATYCALAVATLLDINNTDITHNTHTWVVSCQTYEGGFGGASCCEAHGGYTFCGVASMIMLGHVGLIDVDALIKWLAYKQMKYEGGFQGRTNKLVDGCYSFWQAACFPMLQEILSEKHEALKADWLYDSRMAQEYVMFCCQDLNSGGLIDKPEKARDLYHTCYTLSGLSIAQHLFEDVTDVIGKQSINKLNATHPIYNITVEAERKARQHFRK